MFKKAVILYSSLITLLLMGSIFSLLRITPSDVRALCQMEQESRLMAQSFGKVSSQQKRCSVKKDLWVATADGKRLHDRIESISSVLSLTPKEGRLEIVEHLHDIRCFMQDKFFDEQGTCYQQMRYFDAASGSYEYSTSQFLASSVSLSLFRIAGTELPVSVQGMTPFLKGIAEDVSFGASGPSSQFQAKRFKASFGRQKETHP